MHPKRSQPLLKKTLLNNNKHTLAWIAWSMAASFYLYQFVIRVAPGVLSSDLLLTFNCNTYDLGHLGSAYYRTYALAQIPLGFMLDRFGPKRLISLSALCAAIGTLFFAQAPTLEVATFGRLLMGLGAACGFIGTIKLANDLFPPERIARVIGVTMMMGTVGASIGGLPLAASSEVFGWRNSMFAVGIAGIGLAAFIFLILSKALPKTNHPQNAFSKNSYPNILKSDEIKPIQHHDGIINTFINVAKRPQVWLVGIFGGLLYVPLAAIADLWGVPFLTTSHGLSKQNAAAITSFIYYGIALGSPLMAYVCEKTQSRKIPMRIAAISSLLLYSFMISTNQIPHHLLYPLFFLSGVAFCGQAMVFAIISESLPKNLTGLGLGMINTLIMCSGVIFEPLIGYILHLTSHARNEEGIGIDPGLLTFEDFQIALLSVPICMVIALFILKFIKESFKHHSNQ